MAEPVSAEPAYVFSGVQFQSPILKLVQAVLGPFVAHQAECPGADACVCGLKAALADLERREILIKRYGADG